MSVDDTIVPVASTGRPPAVLQFLPSLVSGGVERGTVELAGALVERDGSRMSPRAEARWSATSREQEPRI